ncbi:hypothetical protein BDV28DRAFT_52780 [Aspergillus coremiiformis]|uniref:Uncharacterized protein n=1 Tax=Aspergillus coremiiformis TaxID=138285 RepID=A0A5N6YZJ8_9EURO|nr:hypothetical protein BDV28DRAFT_52780 [Aspergillus coremiiformis]
MVSLDPFDGQTQGIRKERTADNRYNVWKETVHVQEDLQEVDVALLPRTSSAEPNLKQTAPRKQFLSFDTWSWEILSVIFSILCFIAILVILFIYDGRASPALPHGIRLNTVVSVLATGSKSVLIFIVSAAIGQLKWIWFRKRNQLFDIQLFDDASRGPWGSLILLFKRRTWSLVSLGALVTVLATAFDPFMQQVLSYPMRQVQTPSEMAAVQQCSGYSANAGDDFTMRRAVNAGYWTSDFAMNPVCESGDCTWPDFKSVGFCSRCEDITSTATLQGCTDVPFDPNINTTQYTRCEVILPQGTAGNVPITVTVLPSGHYAMGVPNDAIWTVNSLGNVAHHKATYGGIENPLYVLAHANLDLPTTSDVNSHPEKGLRINKVTQCAISLCARNYRISVRRGTPLINVTSTDYGKVVPSSDTSEEMCWLSGAPSLKPVRENPANHTQFAVCNATDLRASIAPATLIGKFYYQWTFSPAEFRSPGALPWSLTSVGKTADDKVTVADDFHNVLNTTLDTVMQNIAASLTKHGRDGSSDIVHGTVSVSEVYVAVNWRWVSLPLAILLLTVLFFVLTLLADKKNGRGLWKSSVLPVLYHGLDGRALSDVDEYATISYMEEYARAMEVELQLSDSNRRLILK